MVIFPSRSELAGLFGLLLAACLLPISLHGDHTADDAAALFSSLSRHATLAPTLILSSEDIDRALNGKEIPDWAITIRSPRRLRFEARREERTFIEVHTYEYADESSTLLGVLQQAEESRELRFFRWTGGDFTSADGVLPQVAGADFVLEGEKIEHPESIVAQARFDPDGSLILSPKVLLQPVWTAVGVTGYRELAYRWDGSEFEPVKTTDVTFD